MTTGTALSVIERAAVALGSSALEIHLADLAKQHADITAISNKDGREQVHSAAMVLRGQRTSIQKTGKAARDDATKFSQAVIAEEKRLIAMIEPEEERLIKLRDEWDQEQERIKRAAAEAEAKRKAWHESQVAGIRELVLKAGGASAESIAALIAELRGIEPRKEIHAECMPAVALAKSETMDRLVALHESAVSAEAEQARIKAEQEAEAARLAAEREELARLRAEAEARRQEEERKAAEARAAEEARMAAERAEIARHREAQEAKARAEREEFERQVAELRAQQEAVRKQQEAAAAEEKRLKDEKGAAERRAAEEKERAERQDAEDKARAEREEAARLEAERVAKEEAANRRAREASPPEAGDVIRLVAEHYRVSEQAAQHWLTAMFGMKQAA